MNNMYSLILTHTRILNTSDQNSKSLAINLKLKESIDMHI